ncbi:three-helix bundle dimerization domain-containing protein [Streptomyces sp. NPDC056628]|uniref:three-helix bundle dimerization domain-containing protein n=1 Tax=Streptomyces sp. NPDC056628 TaxID=3345882 RepID=UPI00369D9E0B
MTARSSTGSCGSSVPGRGVPASCVAGSHTVTRPVATLKCSVFEERPVRDFVPALVERRVRPAPGRAATDE